MQTLNLTRSARRRAWSAMLALILLLGALPPIPLNAANVGQNAYGHTVNYTPMTTLYAARPYLWGDSAAQAINLFDAQTTQWNAVPKATREMNGAAKTWLSKNRYLLNNFGKLNTSKTSTLWLSHNSNSNYEGKITAVPGNSQYDIYHYSVYYDFSSLKNSSDLANINNMLAKGDIEYFFTTGLKSVQTRWAIFAKSNDYADLWFMGDHHRKSGDGWHYINWTNGNGPTYSDSAKWKPSSSIGEMHFKGESDRDTTINSYMGWGMLVGRDIAGPRIQSVRVTSDAAGTQPLSGGITLDTLDDLTDRTVYFQVTWDEPVHFSGLTKEQVAALQLEVQTLGVDGTSGMPARASFLKFAPTKTDSTPVMTFEYKIPDPYTDTSQVTQERGFYYNFSKIAVSGSDNRSLWNNLTDIAGNKFAANRNGQQTSGKVELGITGSPFVDQLPFAVHNVAVSKTSAPDETFIQRGEQFDVRLELNKTLQSGAGLPEITLNVKDAGTGDYVRLATTNTGTARVNGAVNNTGSILSSKISFDPAKHTVDAADGVVRIRSVEPKAMTQDTSGYKLMEYALNDAGALSPTDLPAAASGKLSTYLKAPNRQYRLDFAAPEIAVEVSDEGDNIIMAKAAVTDANLEGSGAAFRFDLTGRADGVIQYQSSTTEGYDGSAWQDATAGGTQISFSAPVTGSGGTRNAYAFIKLPSEGVEINNVAATVTIADEAGNQMIATGNLPPDNGSWDGADNMPPVVTLEKTQETDGVYAGRDDFAKITLTDMNDTTWRFVWQDTYDTDGFTRLPAPDFSAAQTGDGDEAHFPDLASLTENKVYNKTLWVQGADAAGNDSDPVSMDFDFNRTFAEIVITSADTETQYTDGNYPSVDITVNNVDTYKYIWVERPANYQSEAGTDYGDLANYFKNQTGTMSTIAIANAATEVTPESAATDATITMDGATPVVLHDDTQYDSKWAWTGGGIDVTSETVSADATTRPVALLIWAQGANNTSFYKAVEFDTFYEAPAAIGVRQDRFSSNDNNGQRTDNLREVRDPALPPYMPTAKGLYWPSDYDDPSYYGSTDAGALFNARSINGFAEAEFYIAGDPLTGLDRVDLNNSVITLEQVQYDRVSDYLGTDELEWAEEYSTIARETIAEWALSDLTINPAQDPRPLQMSYYHAGLGETFSPFYTASLNFDPSIVDASPYVVTGPDEYGNQIYNVVRYEFRIQFAYENGTTDDKNLLSYWIFDNSAPFRGRLNAITEDAEYGGVLRDLYFDPLAVPVEAIFDGNGNDITPNIPVVTFDSYGEPVALQIDPSEFAYSFDPVYSATEASRYASPPVPLGIDLTVRSGSSPDAMTNITRFVGLYGAHLPVGTFPEHGSEKTLYYQFYDDKQGGESPVYVMTLRQDGEPPVVALSVSETEAPQREVTVKLDSVYDIHEVQSGEGTTYVIDTPSPAIECYVEAFRKIMSGETFNTTDPDAPDYYDPDYDFNYDYDEEIDDYVLKEVRVWPNEDGAYVFTNNGFVYVHAVDAAWNYTESLLVNGEPYMTPGEGYEVRTSYLVNNIDREPPVFASEPVWTPDAEAGSFTLAAAVEDADEGTAAYIRFDKDYAELISGEDYDEHTLDMDGDNPGTEAVEDGYTVTIPATEPPLYNIENVPGYFSGAFDPATGEINLTAYVKYGEGASLSSATLVVTDSAGNAAERQYDFVGGLAGIEPRITNATAGIEENVNNYPVYSYGGTLDFSAPVMIDDFKTAYLTAHGGLPIYADGTAIISYTDLFGTSRSENIYADIFGPAFRHQLTFLAGETEIDPTTPTNQDVTVKVDTGGTPGLTVAGGTVWEQTLSENGGVTYTLTNSDLSQTKTFTLPVTNIDKTVPTPIVDATLNSVQTEITDAETGEITVQTLIYAITYEILGFDESNVSVIDSDGSVAPQSVTFDGSSANKTYTFRFRDAAGNEGVYTADATEITFSDPADAVIAGYRLNYESSGKDGSSMLGTTESGGATPAIGLTNGDVTVRVEALNAAGEVIPAALSVSGGLPAGTVHFAASRSVLFTGENAADRVVTAALTGTGAGNTISFQITLPGGTIDQTAPIGTVNYVDTEDGGVKAYLVPISQDIAEDGVTVTGHRGDGTALVLQNDADGYFVAFDENGSGHFMLLDNAGNMGTVAIAVQSVDTGAPALGAEGWSADTEASSKSDTWADDLESILSTPTNNSIKVFFSFNEQLSRAEVTAYDRKDGSVLTPTEDYVTIIVSGSTVTVEFLQNCQAMIVVYDLRGNATTLWRPEDGPITVIDKDAPALADGSPQIALSGNKSVYTYAFKDNEQVMLLSDPDSGYKNSHDVEFTANGQYVLTFADHAGNVLSVYPSVDALDTAAPHIRMSTDLVGEGTEYGGKDENDAAYYYTSKNMRLLLNITDATQAGMTVTAKRLGGADVPVVQETVSQMVGDELKTYQYTVTTTENGVYEIIAKDQWGQENTVNANITLIDKTAPIIGMESTKAVSVERNADADAVILSVLQCVTATDTGSGKANGGVTVSADISAVRLDTPGSYTATITAADPLGNTTAKTRTVNVRSGEVRLFIINGQTVEANDVFATSPATVGVSVSDASFGGEKVTLYYAQGYKTAAQMKYATLFDGTAGFEATEKGYYTIMAQSAERGMYLVYVYVY